MIDDESAVVNRKIKKRLTYLYMLNHIVGWFLAAIISLFFIGYCSWLIVVEYKNGSTGGLMGWCQTVIAFLLGVWITDKPQFIKEYKEKFNKK